MAIVVLMLSLRAGRAVVAPKSTAVIAAICVLGAIGFAITPPVPSYQADADATAPTAAPVAVVSEVTPGPVATAPVTQDALDGLSAPLPLESPAEPTADACFPDEPVPEEQLWQQDAAYEEPVTWENHDAGSDTGYEEDAAWEEPWEEPGVDGGDWEEPAWEPQAPTVYIAASGEGKRYHTDPGCSGMNGTIPLTVDEAVSMDKTPCGKCC